MSNPTLRKVPQPEGGKEGMGPRCDNRGGPMVKNPYVSGGPRPMKCARKTGHLPPHRCFNYNPVTQETTWYEWD